ncbi:type VI secretion system protein TssA [Pseudomonas agarici]|uniref:type VI secretion system protein TssA n=2 Tax=Pseudomonas agarici TaxID=46677 RepID=UPI0008B2FBA5|nr:type VI secretion system protein TssA [Pseudomonas agarici]NWB89951.1 type VI secretion system protein TssA [Pseudomonas agarici]NWC08268.1 type VI secretion system protein TssA [Pseudomonas agarici]SEK82319.1 type VI secretion system protein ImpA [Pseudomonas agarici]
MNQSGSGLSLLVEPLLVAICAEAPCGQNLRYEADYDRLRELRREDDTSLSNGVWEKEIKRAEWAGVEQLASEILRSRSKDLMVAAWLGEAWLHRHGLEGLRAALALLLGLCERYPDQLHPQAEEGDRSWRVTPVDWLVRRYAEVLHTRVPLFAPGGGNDFSGMSLYGWQQLQGRQVLTGDNKSAKAIVEAARLEQQKVNELIRATPLSWWLHNQNLLLASLHQLEALEQWVDHYLAELAPTCGPLRDVMQALSTLTQEFIAMHPQQPEPPVVPTPTDVEEDEPVAAATTQQASRPAAPCSREEAYRQLLLIADYLAKTEPHSPVPYVVKKAVAWGNKPLNELLSELISSDAEARRVWALLGVL